MHWLPLVVSLPSLLAGDPPLDAAALSPLSVDAQEGSDSEPAPEPADWAEREKQLLARIAALEEELRAERRRSLERTNEWLAYIRVLQGFAPASLPEPPEFLAEELAPKPDPAAEAERVRAALARARGDEIEVQLRALLVADGVRTLDVLEVGAPFVHRGRGVTGPVVARVLDERGRLTGMLGAERLWVEVSRAGRSATLVLEEGYQSRGGVRSTFEGEVLGPRSRAGAGTRRIPLPDVDPEAWIDALPDLVDADALAPLVDDGTWDMPLVRSSLELLLVRAAPKGAPRWKLAALGGVRGTELRDVQFAEIPAGRTTATRFVFADRARIVVPPQGPVTIELEDGTVRRGERSAPFLEGRFRIVLPFADVTSWRGAAIPTVGGR